MSPTDTNLTTRLQQILDRNEITDLVYRLGVCLDEGRFDDMRELFVEDATVRTPGGVAEGREALIAQARRNHRPQDGIQHVIANLLVDIAGDHAKIRANLVVHFAPQADVAQAEPALAPPIEVALGDVYRFDTVRTPEGWRFSRVETIPVWIFGSVSRLQQPRR
jgi:hypothetical protein